MTFHNTKLDATAFYSVPVWLIDVYCVLLHVCGLFISHSGSFVAFLNKAMDPEYFKSHVSSSSALTAPCHCTMTLFTKTPHQ